MISQTIEMAPFFANFFLLIADLTGYIYVLIKIYRVLCFSKITFDQLPMFNPYTWPFSVIRIITQPYFKFWSKLLPNLKLGKISYDVSAILGLELLSGLLFLCSQLRILGLIEAQRVLNDVNLSN